VRRVALAADAAAALDAIARWRRMAHDGPALRMLTWAMSLVDPQHPWLARVMLGFGFLGIAVVAFAAGWLVGTMLPWLGAG
jgi:hypothetical protein